MAPSVVKSRSHNSRSDRRRQMAVAREANAISRRFRLSTRPELSPGVSRPRLSATSANDAIVGRATEEFFSRSSIAEINAPMCNGFAPLPRLPRLVTRRRFPTERIASAGRVSGNSLEALSTTCSRRQKWRTAVFTSLHARSQRRPNEPSNFSFRRTPFVVKNVRGRLLARLSSK